MPNSLMRRTAPQLELFTPRARKRRRGVRLGRPPRKDRLGFVPHVTRPEHRETHPVHVTIRRSRLAPSMRSQIVASAILVQMKGAKRRGIRVVQFSIQEDHLHLMVEAQDGKELARAMQYLFSRIALAVNRVLGRRGSLFADRHHRHELKTPTETRRALVYILFNTRKHIAGEAAFSSELFASMDAQSSAPWFGMWHPEARPPPDVVARCRDQQGGESPLSTPKTWLARGGWQRAGGPIRFDDRLRVTN